MDKCFTFSCPHITFIFKHGEEEKWILILNATHLIQPTIHFFCLCEPHQRANHRGGSRPHYNSDIQASHHFRRGCPHAARGDDIVHCTKQKKMHQLPWSRMEKDTTRTLCIILLRIWIKITSIAKIRHQQNDDTSFYTTTVIKLNSARITIDFVTSSWCLAAV